MLGNGDESGDLGVHPASDHSIVDITIKAKTAVTTEKARISSQSPRRTGCLPSRHRIAACGFEPRPGLAGVLSVYYCLHQARAVGLFRHFSGRECSRSGSVLL